MEPRNQDTEGRLINKAFIGVFAKTMVYAAVANVSLLFRDSVGDMLQTTGLTHDYAHGLTDGAGVLLGLWAYSKGIPAFIRLVAINSINWQYARRNR